MSDRKQADEAVRNGEERYRALFNQMTEGFALHEIICDERGEPCDYRFLDVNPAFEQLTGLTRTGVVGRTMRQVLPSEEHSWIATYGDVALTGRPIHFDRYAAALHRYYDVIAYRPAPRQFAVVFTDVSERKRTEHALREREAVVRGILDTVSESVALMDAEGVVLACNETAARRLGKTPDDLIGRSVRELFRDEVARSRYASVRAVVAEGKKVQTEDRREGRWFEQTIYPVYDDNGRVVRVVLFARDVTQRKIQEREIERLNRLYAALSELNQVIVRVKSRAELFREVCRITTEKAGFQLAWIGWVDEETRRVVPIARGGARQDYLDEVPVYADDRPQGQGPTGTSIRENRVCVVHDFLNDASTAPWHAAADRCGFRTAAALPIRFRGATCGTLTAYDDEPNVIRDKEVALLEDAAAAISLALENLDHESQRKQAEAALRESEQRQKAILDTIPDHAWLKDKEGRFLAVNAAWCGFFGMVAADVLGKTGFEFLPREVAQRLLEKDHCVIQSRQPLCFEEALRDKDGRLFWFETIKAPLGNDRGEVAGTTGLARNITERKRAEQEKLELERRLLHAQKLESIGILAGGIAHDFNNILAGILGYTDLIKLRLPESAPLHADLEVIRKAVQRAADLTRQMLAYSGKGTFLVEPVNLSQIVQDSRNMLAMSVSKKATVTYNLAADLPPILADASQIHQIVLNLVINASEALDERNGVIAVSTDVVPRGAAERSLPAAGDALPDGDCVRLEVTDTGCGMDQETLGKIFDPFFTTKFTGRGLGLAAVHGIVRGHKGTVRVFSEPGQGTTFQVLFPAHDAAAALAAAESLPARPWRGAGTLLIVDDEESVRTMARRMAEQAGFAVLTAGDGDEALRLYRRRHAEIVCVLLDLTMPKMNGEETLRELRRIRPDVRVILSSGYSEEGATERFAKLGLAGFIQKPYPFDALVARLRDAVAQGGTGRDPAASPPAAGGAPPGEKAHRAATPPRHEVGTVLVVDDDDLNRKSAQVLFEQAGFATLAAPDGEDAIRVYRQHQERIVCVFLDLTLPRMSGEDTFRELRRLDPAVRVIVTSGWSEETLAERFAGLDVFGFVCKPDSPDDAIAKLRAAILNCAAG